MRAESDAIESGHVEAKGCEESNSVGAGDTFNAQLVYSLASALTPKAAVEAGLLH